MKEISESQTLADIENPHSLIGLIEGSAFSNAVAKVSPDLWSLDEEHLRERAKPTHTDYALRIALWNEFRIACSDGSTISPQRIYANICSYQHWWQNVLNNPAKVAWLMHPLQEHEDMLKPLLARISERYFEILNMDIYDSEGKPVPSLVKALLKAMEQIEGRVCGEPVQRSESKNLNVSLETHSHYGKPIASMTDNEKRAYLAELKAENRRFPGMLDRP